MYGYSSYVKNFQRVGFRLVFHFEKILYHIKIILNRTHTRPTTCSYLLFCNSRRKTRVFSACLLFFIVIFSALFVTPFYGTHLARAFAVPTRRYTHKLPEIRASDASAWPYHNRIKKFCLLKRSYQCISTYNRHYRVWKISPCLCFLVSRFQRRNKVPFV